MVNEENMHVHAYCIHLIRVIHTPTHIYRYIPLILNILQYLYLYIYIYILNPAENTKYKGGEACDVDLLIKCGGVL